MNQIDMMRTNVMVIEGCTDNDFMIGFRPILISKILKILLNEKDYNLKKKSLRAYIGYNRIFSIPLHIFREFDEISSTVYSFFNNSIRFCDDLNIAGTINHCINYDSIYTVNIDAILFYVDKNKQVCKIELKTKDDNLLMSSKMMGIESYNLSEKECSSRMVVYNDTLNNRYSYIRSVPIDLKIQMNLCIASCKDIVKSISQNNFV